jgi:hypothetical protein
MSQSTTALASVWCNITHLEFEALEAVGQEIQNLAARFQIEISKTSYTVERRMGSLELTGMPSQVASFVTELGEVFPELELSAPTLLGPALVG